MQTPSSRSKESLRSRFANRSDVTALLAAFCFFLSTIEYMLPKPMPFMRLGIANLPIFWQWIFCLSIGFLCWLPQKWSV